MHIYKIFLHSFQLSITVKTVWRKGLEIQDIQVIRRPYNRRQLRG